MKECFSLYNAILALDVGAFFLVFFFWGGDDGK
jgi:hypothetical protein